MPTSKTPREPNWQKRWKYERSHGIFQLVDAAPVRAHLQQLRDSGMTVRAIGHATGDQVSRTALYQILRTDQPKVKRRIAATLLAVRPGPVTYKAAEQDSFVPRVGTVRRIQALLAIGWPHKELRARCGLNTSILLSQPGEWVTIRTHQRIQRLYDDLSMTLGPSTITRSRAAALGYAPPLAWDDDDLDNPAARPARGSGHHLSRIDDQAVERAVSGDRVDLNAREREQAVTQLHRAGLNDQQIARRLHLADRTVLRIRQRLDLPANQPAGAREGAA